MSLSTYRTMKFGKSNPIEAAVCKLFFEYLIFQFLYGAAEVGSVVLCVSANPFLYGTESRIIRETHGIVVGRDAAPLISGTGG